MRPPILPIQIDLACLGYRPGPLDGLWGPKTQAALDVWRKSWGELNPPEGRPAEEEMADLTAEATVLRSRTEALITPAILRQLAPLSSRRRYAVNEAGLVASLRLAQQLAGATTHRRAAHFLAQLAHESYGFRALTEYSDGLAYEGREDLGNTQKGDGPRYKGRGWIQLTGRSNYRSVSRFLKESRWEEVCPRLGFDVDVETSPGFAVNEEVAAAVAAWFWLSRGLNGLADADDHLAITKAINGGTNGLSSRLAYLAKAKATLGAS